MGDVILVRHGQTAYNDTAQKGASAERIRGWKDVPLDEEGEKQAKAIAEKLRGTAIDDIYSSKLSRATDVADEIAREHGLTVTKTSALMPWNVGDWAGQPVKDVLADMKACISDETKRPPNGESFREFRKRYLSFLLDALHEEDGVCCLVTHTRNAQCAKAWIAAGGPMSLDIDEATMNDYSDELPVGEEMRIALVKGKPVIKSDAKQYVLKRGGRTLGRYASKEEAERKRFAEKRRPA